MIRTSQNTLTVDLASMECNRVLEQARLDTAKSAAERNRLGQFATPNALAIAILNYSKSLLSPTEKVRFLDPAIGTGSFYSALLQTFPNKQIERAIGYEVDPDVAAIAHQLWASTPLTVELADFTKVPAPEQDRLKSNLLICNPPYVRHHHLSTTEKQFLKSLAIARSSIQLSGLAGLYCYFLLAAHEWMTEGGLACWLIPSEFMDVNYGRQIKAYLLDRVTLLRVHRFEPEDLQFGDALVSSSVIWFRNTQPQQNHTVEFTCGGRIEHSSLTKTISTQVLRTSLKWATAFTQERQRTSQVKLSDLFEIKRGVATGANQFFMLTPEQTKTLEIPQEFLTPILPSSRYLLNDEILADEQGHPILDRKLFLLTCTDSPEELQQKSPAVWKYLQCGVEAGIPKGYLCRHRSHWYLQENRQPALFLCTYMGRSGAKRGNPFRFILNHSSAIAPNVYLMMYPKAQLASLLSKQPALLQLVWNALKSIPVQTLIHEGRVYGDGLHKLEPKELANAPAEEIVAAITLAAKTFK
jgi:adenine-specific DNA-methyltransferase